MTCVHTEMKLGMQMRMHMCMCRFRYAQKRGLPIFPD